MHEGIPQFEQAPITPEEAALAFREGHPDAKEKLALLFMQWESETGASLTERVGYIRRQAEFYKSADLIEDALLALDDAVEMAYQEGNDTLVAEIEQEIANLQTGPAK